MAWGNWTRFIIWCVVAIGVQGCKPLQGELQLSESLDLRIEESNIPCNNEVYDPNCGYSERSETLSAGRYGLNITQNSARLIHLEFEGPKSVNMSIELPAGVSIPRYNGDVRVRGSEIGQTWDLSGRIQSNMSRSANYTQYEECSIEVERWECRENRRGNRGGRDCRRVIDRIRGYQYVEFFYEITDTYADLKFEKEARVIGTYSGHRQDQNKIYTFKGLCGR